MQFCTKYRPLIRFQRVQQPVWYNRNLLLCVLISLGLLTACGGDGEIVDPQPPDSVTCHDPLNGEVEVAGIVNTAGIEWQKGDESRQTELTIPLGEEVLLCDAGAITVETPIENTAFGNIEDREIPVLSSRLNGRSLELVLDGPVSQDGELYFGDGAIVTNRGPNSAEGTVFLESGNLLTPAEATRWFKAYEPGNENLFTGIYPGSSQPVGIPQPQDEASVFSSLDLHLQNVMDAGFLSLDEMTELMNRFYDPAAREVFIKPETGKFEPFLMAMTLATAGTAGAEAVSAIIDGDNETGRPARVVFADIGPAFAHADVITNENGQQRWLISLTSRLKEDPFQAGAALLAHEGVHQDNSIGQDEEVLGKLMEIRTWADKILADPSLASLGTVQTKGQNLQLLMHLNSGRNFPSPGLFESQFLQPEQNVLPGSNQMARSLDDALRTFFYSGVEDIETSGNDYLDQFLSQGGDEVTGANFNDEALEIADGQRLFTPQEEAEILRILQLQPAADGSQWTVSSEQ